MGVTFSDPKRKEVDFCHGKVTYAEAIGQYFQLPPVDETIRTQLLRINIAYQVCV